MTYLEELFERINSGNPCYVDPPIKEYPELLTHEIKGCEKSFDNLNALRIEKYYHVREYAPLNDEVINTLNTYLNYDYSKQCFIKDLGICKILVVLKPIRGFEDNKSYTKYYVAAQVLLDNDNHLLKNMANKQSIVLFDDHYNISKFIAFNENYYQQTTVAEYKSLQMFSIICKRYDDTTICRAYFSYCYLNLIPFSKLTFIIKEREHQGSAILSYDESLNNCSQKELVDYMATFDNKQLDVLEMYLV